MTVDANRSRYSCAVPAALGAALGVTLGSALLLARLRADAPAPVRLELGRAAPLTVPEPATAAVLGLGLAALLRRKPRSPQPRG